VGTSSVPLQEADPRALVDNRQPGVDQWHQQPRLMYQSFQNSFSSRIEVFFVLQHPLVLSVWYIPKDPGWLTDVEFVSVSS
jgi:hypothetical protein